MNAPLRLVVRILGVVFTLQGIGWLVAPGRAAESLGMPLLDGLGRSTQIGDFAAFFFTAGVAMLVGTRPGRARVLILPAALLGSAAFCRAIAWLLHGAAFAAFFIAVEIAAALLLLRAAGSLDTPR